MTHREQAGPDPSERTDATGNAEAAYRRGLDHHLGRRAHRDDAEAVRWFRMAAAQGHTAARFYLGLLHEMGNGVTGGRAEAARWYRQAAQGRQPDSQYNLGRLHYSGIGVARDTVTAYRWLSLAMAQGTGAPWLTFPAREGIAAAETLRDMVMADMAPDDRAEAIFNLGILYQHGLGVPPDPAEAVRHFTQAADHGHHLARYELQVLAGRGDPTPPRPDHPVFAWSGSATRVVDLAREVMGRPWPTATVGTPMPDKPPGPAPGQPPAAADPLVSSRWLVGGLDGRGRT